MHSLAEVLRIVLKLPANHTWSGSSSCPVKLLVLPRVAVKQLSFGCHNINSPNSLAGPAPVLERQSALQTMLLKTDVDILRRNSIPFHLGARIPQADIRTMATGEH